MSIPPKITFNKQVSKLVKLFDGKFPETYLNLYLEYYQITELNFIKTLGYWIKKDLFEINSKEITTKLKIK